LGYCLVGRDRPRADVGEQLAQGFFKHTSMLPPLRLTFRM
jgi:hypothetical protein